jgi:hypothetical protein
LNQSALSSLLISQKKMSTYNVPVVVQKGSFTDCYAIKNECDHLTAGVEATIELLNVNGTSAFGGDVAIVGNLLVSGADDPATITCDGDIVSSNSVQTGAIVAVDGQINNLICSASLAYHLANAFFTVTWNTSVSTTTTTNGVISGGVGTQWTFTSSAATYTGTDPKTFEVLIVFKDGNGVTTSAENVTFSTTGGGVLFTELVARPYYAGRADTYLGRQIINAGAYTFNATKSGSSTNQSFSAIVSIKEVNYAI